VFEILGYKRPKYSERPSIGYKPELGYREFNETLPVYEDGFGKYIVLDPNFWHVYKSGWEAFNISEIFLNDTYTVNVSTLQKALENRSITYFIKNNETDILARRI
jgi:hypothetical protein